MSLDPEPKGGQKMNSIKRPEVFIKRVLARFVSQPLNSCLFLPQMLLRKMVRFPQKKKKNI